MNDTPFRTLFEVNSLAEGLEIAQNAKKKQVKRISKEERAQIKADDLKQIRDREEAKKPAFKQIIHKPTYCVQTWLNINGEPVKHDRAALSAFKSKQDGEMSQQAKSRFSTALNWLFLFADRKTVYSKKPWINKQGKEQHIFSFRLAMITLTLSSPQVHPDKHIKEKMLQPFLNWLTQAHRCSYVWKAETQLNGNIHFHINVDKFILWKSVRSKWNSIMQTQGYCKVFNDGSNDKGDAATEIKAIKNEKGLAAVVGGYLTKNSLEEKYHYAIIEGKKRMQEQRQLPINFIENDFKKCTTIEELVQKGSFISCSKIKKPDGSYIIQHYTRLVDGRTWGQSESISNVDVRMDDCTDHHELYETEHEFFHRNNLKRLSGIMLQEAQKKYSKHSEQEKFTLGYDDISLKKKFQRYDNVFIHRNLKFCNLPDYLAKKITDEKSNRKFHGQKHFTIESLI